MRFNLKPFILDALAIPLLILPQASAAPVSTASKSFKINIFKNFLLGSPVATTTKPVIDYECWPYRGRFVQFMTYGGAPCVAFTWSGTDCHGSSQYIGSGSVQVAPVTFGSVSVSCDAGIGGP